MNCPGAIETNNPANQDSRLDSLAMPFLFSEMRKMCGEFWSLLKRKTSTVSSYCIWSARLLPVYDTPILKLRTLRASTLAIKTSFQNIVTEWKSNSTKCAPKIQAPRLLAPVLQELFCWIFSRALLPPPPNVILAAQASLSNFHFWKKNFSPPKKFFHFQFFMHLCFMPSWVLKHFLPKIFLGEARCDTMLPSISSFFCLQQNWTHSLGRLGLLCKTTPCSTNKRVDDFSFLCFVFFYFFI